MSYLVPATSVDGAEALFKSVCAQYYGDVRGEPVVPDESGRYYSVEGRVRVTPRALAPISLATFFELRRHLPCRTANTVSPTLCDELEKKAA